jgi:hypothetical protein
MSRIRNTGKKDGKSYLLIGWKSPDPEIKYKIRIRFNTRADPTH